MAGEAIRARAEVFHRSENHHGGGRQALVHASGSFTATAITSMSPCWSHTINSQLINERQWSHCSVNHSHEALQLLDEAATSANA